MDLTETRTQSLGSLLSGVCLEEGSAIYTLLLTRRETVDGGTRGVSGQDLMIWSAARCRESWCRVLATQYPWRCRGLGHDCPGKLFSGAFGSGTGSSKRASGTAELFCVMPSLAGRVFPLAALAAA